MRAVIVELRGKYAAALSDDGCVNKLENKNYTIGQVVEYKAAKNSYSKIIIRIASAAAIIAAIGIPTYAYCTPYSYVSLDFNPSIEYALNRFDRVLSYTAANEEGAQILAHLQLKNKNINEAIELTLYASVDEGYLTTAESGALIITASSRDDERSNRLAETLADTAKATAQEQELEIEVEAEGVGQERVQQAKALGVTAGKLTLIEKLQESTADDAQINVEEWLEKPVKEIIKQTKENNKPESNASAANPDREKADTANTADGKGNAKDSGKIFDDNRHASNGKAQKGAGKGNYSN